MAFAMRAAFAARHVAGRGTVGAASLGLARLQGAAAVSCGGVSARVRGARWMSGGEGSKQQQMEDEARALVHEASHGGKPPPPKEPEQDAGPEAWAAYFNEKFLYDMDHYETPKDMDPAKPLNFLDLDAYLESVKPDWETKPAGLEDIRLEYDFKIYPPYKALFFKDKFQPDKKVKVTLKVEDLALSPSQTDFMMRLLGNRFKPKRGTMSLVSRDGKDVKENMERVKQLLAQVVAEIRKH